MLWIGLAGWLWIQNAWLRGELLEWVQSPLGADDFIDAMQKMEMWFAALPMGFLIFLPLLFHLRYPDTPFSEWKAWWIALNGFFALVLLMPLWGLWGFLTRRRVVYPLGSLFLMAWGIGILGISEIREGLGVPEGWATFLNGLWGSLVGWRFSVWLKKKIRRHFRERILDRIEEYWGLRASLEELSRGEMTLVFRKG